MLTLTLSANHIPNGNPKSILSYSSLCVYTNNVESVTVRFSRTTSPGTDKKGSGLTTQKPLWGRYLTINWRFNAKQRDDSKLNFFLFIFFSKQGYYLLSVIMMQCSRCATTHWTCSRQKTQLCVLRIYCLTPMNMCVDPSDLKFCKTLEGGSRTQGYLPRSVALR